MSTLVHLLWIPLVAAVLPHLRIGFIARDPIGFGRYAAGFVLAMALVQVAAFDYGTPARMQQRMNEPWISALSVRFHLGIDGVSLPLVVLTALLVFLCFVHLGRREVANAGLLTSLLLILEVGMIGTFLALDLVLFFVFFEIVLLPMFAVIALWGGPRRKHAAYKFLLFTLAGSALLLAGLVLIGWHARTFDMIALAGQQGRALPHGVQIAAFALVGLGLAVKAPIWPLHTWLPDAHTEAPTVGSVLLAGVLLKMGTYGLVRIAVPAAPEGAAYWAPWLGVLAAVGIVYGALACLAQTDLKRMIAYSSVGHMGFVLLGIATLTPVGLNAALFGNIAHGLITGLLFFLAGSVKDRYGTGDLTELGGGMLARAPRLASVLTFACVASLALPGLAGFWGEMMTLVGAYSPAEGLPRDTFLVLMVVAAFGAVLTAAYFLRLLRKITHGRATGAEAGGAVADVRAAEWAAWAPLIVLVLLVGLWPKVLLALTDGPVRALIGAGS
ncbi:NADH-quinone oxidoreductase subunit M [Actinocorallia herbida]|uniref:NADH-quinone oxidoreductase subunit M n=1 Tax=Actinocorallia herbida TaxID=58109 RepID=A0A3N1D9U5_9ACTN|nr:NADH-quinone oxidoreductase subunit M [Actinocorallia herbida]ROO90266.1 NADH-quinone oxidoreductase subunit M [Actinocorallia herbida]